MAKKAISPFDKVVIEIPLVKGDTEAIYVHINDFRGKITRGEKVTVPRYVAEWLINNQYQVKQSERFNKSQGQKI